MDLLVILIGCFLGGLIGFVGGYALRKSRGNVIIRVWFTGCKLMYPKLTNERSVINEDIK